MHRGYGILLAAALLLGSGGSSLAEEPPGLSLDGSFVHDSSHFLGPGAPEDGETPVRGLFGLEALWDLEPALGWSGARLFASWQWRRGADGSALAGDGQGFSNIDGAEFQRVAELWLEQRRGPFRFKLGSVDANADFAALEAAGTFLNSSFGLSPTLEGLPTYPAAGLGGMAFASMGEALSLGLGALATCSVPDRLCLEWENPLYLAELGRGLAGGGRWAVAAWTRGAPEDGDQRSVGGYFFAESGESRAGLRFFGQLAAAGAVAVDRQGSAGLSLAAPWRPGDEAGLGLTAARFAGTGWETVGELFYRAALTPRLALQPDLQHVHRPAGRGDRAGLWIFSLRVVAGF